MAGSGGCELGVDDLDDSADCIDLSAWTNSKDSDSHQKRSDIIHKLIQDGRLDQLRTLAAGGWDVNEELIGYNGIQPLYHAVTCSRRNERGLDIVELLLGHGAQPNVAHKVSVVGCEGCEGVLRTGLHEAARLRCTEVVTMLLAAGADCTPQGSENPLMLALLEKHCPAQLIEVLLKHGADPNYHKTDEESPLLSAITNLSTEKADHLKIVTLLLGHGANPDVAHRVKIRVCRELQSVHRSALQEAAERPWTGAVKLLLDAGAKCTTSDGLQNPLALALKSYRCEVGLIELLLKHGADPNEHDDQLDNIPLFAVLNNGMHHASPDAAAAIIQLLLEHGADPNVSYREHSRMYPDVVYEPRTALHEAALRGRTAAVKHLLDAGAKSDIHENPLALAIRKHDCPAELIQLLLQHRADLHYVETRDIMDEPRPLLHRLTQYTYCRSRRFLQQSLDLYFQHGGGVNVGDGEGRTALECAIREDMPTNTIRWLLRHGAHSVLRFTLLKGHFMPYQWGRSPDTPLLLLQAGMRVSHGAHTQLSNMVTAARAALCKGAGGRTLRTDLTFIKRIEGMWEELERAEQEELARNQRESTSPEYCPQQVGDLQEFSDKSLHVYPEDESPGVQIWHMWFDQIKGIQEFLSEPQSLQWYSRRCVRENLVSLAPSVVRRLCVPARLKRLILCHEL